MSAAELAEALAAWGGTSARLIKDRENAVYEVALAGNRAALRLHRVGYQSLAAIRSEITWMRELARAGMSVPAPVPAMSGEAVVTLANGRLATVVSWMEGQPLGAAGEPLAGTPGEQATLFHAVGREVARLHNITDGLDLPDGFHRHAWDIEGLLGEQPFWGRFWESPALSPSERALVQEVRGLARHRLRAFAEEGGDFGLIHADVLRENVFVDRGRVSLIDFDDAGFGFRLYDLATLMSQNEEEAHHGELRDAALAGYRSERALPEDAAALLPLFVLLRRFASMGWVVPRAGAGSGKVRLYAERAVRAAEAFLASQD